MYDGSIRIKTEIDTKSFEREIQQMVDRIEELEFELKLFEPNTKEFQEINVELEKSKNKLSDLINKQNKLNESVNKVDFSKWTKALRRTALSLFGVQSILTGVSKASRTYLSQNEQAQQKINALWVALGNLIGPIIEMIADGILKLVGYLNVFVKTLSGGKIDLTKNMNANARATNKAAQAQQKYNKQLASFDEMNVIGDTSSANVDNAISDNSIGFEMPELDDRIVKKLQELAEWLKENWDWIWKVGVALGTVFGIAKISGLLKNIGKLLGFSTGNGSGLIGLSSILKTLGTIGAVAIGIDLVYNSLTGRELYSDIQNVIKGLDELHKKNKEIQKDNKKLHKNYMQILDDKDKEAESYKKGSQELSQYIAHLESNTEAAMATINANEEWERGLNPLEAGLASLDGSLKTHRESTEQSKAEIDRMKESYKKLYDQGLLNETQTQKYTKFMNELGLKTDGTKMSFQEYTDYLNTKVASGQKVTMDNVDTLKDKMGDLKTNTEKLTGTSYILKLQSEIQEPKESALQKLIDTLKRKLKIGLELAYTSGGYFGGSSSSGFRAKGGIYYPEKMPKLGLGGIINNPGRGVPYHGATIAEKAAEAVVPLTDAQQMSLLGETIGKYITVNLTNITELDGRQIARKVNKIQQNNDFIFNR